jgi:hypothetical protein
MARGKAVVLATRSFANQLEATAYFKEMLNRYQPGALVTDDDSIDLAALLERHDEYAQKVGSGVKRFSVVMTEHGTQCFRIERTDGTGTEFSYRHCITQRPPTRKQEVSSAFRWAVRLDLFKKRDEYFAEHMDANGCVQCAETGEMIAKDAAHMDHRAPMTFEVIVTTFLAGKGLAVDSVPITSGQDNQVSPEITDEQLCDDFRRYHAQVAALDLVKNTANLSQSARNRMKPTRIRLGGFKFERKHHLTTLERMVRWQEIAYD